MPPPLFSARSSSSLLMKKSSSSGVKLAPAIHHATVVCFERRNDQKMWYIIQVDPQPSDIRMVPGRPNPQSIARQPYTIARRYEDFTHFAQLLHDTFTSSKLNNMARRAGSQWRNNNAPIVLPKIKSRFNLLPNKQLHVQRRTELDKFVQTLFKLPSFITQSLVVLEFFGQQKADTEEQVLRDNQIITRSPPPSPLRELMPKDRQRLVRSCSAYDLKSIQTGGRAMHKSLSQPDLLQLSAADLRLTANPDLGSSLLKHEMSLEISSGEDKLLPSSSSSRWKRLRYTSFRPKPPAALTPSASLSSLCTQAANKIMPWTSSRFIPPPPPPMPPTPTVAPRPVPSQSTPVLAKRSIRERTYAMTEPPIPMTSSSMSTTSSKSSKRSKSSSISSCRSRASQSTFATSATPSPTISPTLRMIKLKVIYDFDNIIVIQVSRCISLDELRTRIVQKFSDPSMGAIQLQKNFVLLFNDARSSASTHYARHQESGASLISKQQDLAHLMQTKWSRVEKVTLRCII